MELTSAPVEGTTKFVEFESSIQIVKRLLGIAKGMRALMALKLMPLGLSPGNDEFLMALHPDEEISVSRLADKLNIRAPTVSKSVDRLVNLGLVDRSSDARDSRRTMLRITQLGLEAQVQVKEIWLNVGLDFTRDLGVPDADEMNTQLGITDTIMQHRLSRMR